MLQVKQKWGALRIYVTEPSFYPRLTEIEARSREVCENCGAPGTCGWGPSVRTLCEACGRPWQEGTGLRLAGLLASLFDDGNVAP